MPKRVLILGGGYGGMYTALKLRRKAGRKVDITVVDSRPYMTYQPFLPEAAAGSIEPRHAVVPLRKELKGIKVEQGLVTAVRHADREIDIASDYGTQKTVQYDEIV